MPERASPAVNRPVNARSGWQVGWAREGRNACRKGFKRLKGKGTSPAVRRSSCQAACLALPYRTTTRQSEPQAPGAGREAERETPDATTVLHARDRASFLLPYAATPSCRGAHHIRFAPAALTSVFRVVIPSTSGTPTATPMAVPIARPAPIRRFFFTAACSPYHALHLEPAGDGRYHGAGHAGLSLTEFLGSARWDRVRVLHIGMARPVVEMLVARFVPTHVGERPSTCPPCRHRRLASAVPFLLLCARPRRTPW